MLWWCSWSWSSWPEGGELSGGDTGDDGGDIGDDGGETGDDGKGGDDGEITGVTKPMFLMQLVRV